MKYVVTKDENGKEEIFIFPRHLNHNEYADSTLFIKTYKNGDHRAWERLHRKPIAAGFYAQGKCTGRSETLNLDSRGRLDELLIG